MIVIALDSAVLGCSVACLDTKTGRVKLRQVDTDRKQAEILIPMVGDVMSEMELPMSAVDRIAVTRGPGSFTGVRIGLAAARGLGLALNRPVIGYSTLELLARQADPAPRVLALIDTKRDDFYGQVFDESHCEISPARIWTKEEADSFDGLVIWGGAPDVTMMADLASRAVCDPAFHFDAAPSPLYLRDAEVSQPKRPAPRTLFS